MQWTELELALEMSHILSMCKGTIYSAEILMLSLSQKKRDVGGCIFGCNAYLSDAPYLAATSQHFGAVRLQMKLL